MKKRISYLVVVTLCILIQACGPQKEAGKGGGKYGMMDTNTPEFAAVRFFEHIYNDPNLDGAISMATPKLGKIIKSYHTNRNVQRHVFNLPYDEVEIQPDTGNTVGRNEFAKSAVVTIFFTGMLNNNKIEEIRVVEMVRTDKKWLVQKVRADKYL